MKSVRRRKQKRDDPLPPESEDEFKWVSLTMICSEEYEDDNQIVMLYVRDINDDYLKQLDES